jgi:hypothetical protein
MEEQNSSTKNYSTSKHFNIGKMHTKGLKKLKTNTAACFETKINIKKSNFKLQKKKISKESFDLSFFYQISTTITSFKLIKKNFKDFRKKIILHIKINRQRMTVIDEE